MSQIFAQDTEVGPEVLPQFQRFITGRIVDALALGLLQHTIERMATALEELYEDLRRLPEDKLEVAASVIRALRAQEEVEQDIHPDWRNELQKRARDIDEGREELLPEEDVYAHIRQKLRDAREAS